MAPAAAPTPAPTSPGAPPIAPLAAVPFTFPPVPTTPCDKPSSPPEHDSLVVASCDLVDDMLQRELLRCLLPPLPLPLSAPVTFPLLLVDCCCCCCSGEVLISCLQEQGRAGWDAEGGGGRGGLRQSRVLADVESCDRFFSGATSPLSIEHCNISARRKTVLVLHDKKTETVPCSIICIYIPAPWALHHDSNNLSSDEID